CLSSIERVFLAATVFVFLAKRILSLELWMRVCFFKESMSSLRSVLSYFSSRKSMWPSGQGASLNKEKEIFCTSQRHSFGKQAPALRKKDKLFQWLVTTRNHRGGRRPFWSGRVCA